MLAGPPGELGVRVATPRACQIWGASGKMARCFGGPTGNVSFVRINTEALREATGGAPDYALEHLSGTPAASDVAALVGLAGLAEQAGLAGPGLARQASAHEGIKGIQKQRFVSET